ncbi:phage tail assembly chaperone [Phyllobacterium chamaecytisi]|uniref:phage tail assembly chaperone n=1 Tax=Phyllobacterium chamaecytisi TaxID=2876082 RepID=UPI00402A34DB
MPAAAQHVWNWFCVLDMKRSHNGYIWLPISHLEIDAWQRLSGEEVDPWELRAINAMDIEKTKLLNAPKDDSSDVLSSRPVTPDLFDALF